MTVTLFLFTSSLMFYDHFVNVGSICMILWGEAGVSPRQRDYAHACG